jgi:hypothetical protein
MAQRSSSATPNASKRVLGFISFFRVYLRGWIAVVAILPSAVTLKAMPAYDLQRAILATFTTIACVLILALLFHWRLWYAAHAMKPDSTFSAGYN